MRDRYIEMRNSGGIYWQFIYDYVVSKGFNLGVEKFNTGAHFLGMMMNQIIEQLDSEYEVTIIYDTKGQAIKVM
jgi:hypothetical protein